MVGKMTLAALLLAGAATASAQNEPPMDVHSWTVVDEKPRSYDVTICYQQCAEGGQRYFHAELQTVGNRITVVHQHASVDGSGYDVSVTPGLGDRVEVYAAVAATDKVSQTNTYLLKVGETATMIMGAYGVKITRLAVTQ